MVRTSEYTHSFRPKLEKYVDKYSENIDYRIRRRCDEHAHNSAVFQWESDQDSNISGEDTLRTPRITSIPEHKRKFLKSRLANYNQNQVERNIETPADEVQVVNKQFANLAVERDQEDDILLVDREVQTPLWTKPFSGKNNASTQLPSSRRETSMQTRKTGTENSQKVADKSRPKSAPTKVLETKGKIQANQSAKIPVASSRMPLAADFDNEKPPFMAYGYQDRQLVTGTKRTHNVRASSAVRESALRAYKRKQLEIKRHEAAISSPSMRYARQHDTVTNHFDELVRRATAGWSSEYQQAFPQYNRLDYARGASATMPRRPKTPTTGNRLIATV